jgi:hypothetical protein
MSSWSVDFNHGTGLFEYRYTINNTGGVAIVDNARLTVSEAELDPHTGLHDELNFLNDAGLFAYDRVKPAFPLHNYDWRDLDIGAGGSIVLGFDDVHGPTMAPWEIELGAASWTFNQSIPVPFVGLARAASLADRAAG